LMGRRNKPDATTTRSDDNTSAAVTPGGGTPDTATPADIQK